MKKGVLFFVLIFVLFLLGCSKSKKKPLVTSSSGQSSQFSAPKAVFEAFGSEMEKMSLKYNSLGSMMFSSGAKQHKKCFTPGFYTFLIQKEKKMFTRTSTTKKKSYIFSGAKKKGDQKVEILAVEETLSDVQIRNKKTGKMEASEKKSTNKQRFLMVKEGGKWRIEKWSSVCSSCKGSGKCSECDGTGMTKPKDCWFCKGTGKKKGKKCFSCNGTGKSKPRKCFRCRQQKGVCPRCKGKKWKNELLFFQGAGRMMTSILNLTKVTEFFDLSTPEKASKTYINIDSQIGYQVSTTLHNIMMTIKEILGKFFIAKLSKQFSKFFKLKTSPTPKKKMKLSKVEKKGDEALLTFNEPVLWLGKKKTTTRISYWKMKKIQDQWLIDNQGNQCSSCKGTGKCSRCNGTKMAKPRKCYLCNGTGKRRGKTCMSCKGTGKSKPQKCYSCTKNPGLCSYCKGKKIKWKRDL